ncbi:MAG: phage holin family protein [Actinomycetota bacterium]|nr:phage holin family protein [Actinomycetota bacterium]
MNPNEDKSMAELLKQMTEQSNELARKEIELAKAELEMKAKRVGTGIGAFGGAGVVAMLALGALTATLILALATALDAWLAALIVTVVYAAIAGVMALAGKKKVDEGTPPVPEKAIESSQRDVDEIKQSVKEGRNR